MYCKQFVMVGDLTSLIFITVWLISWSGMFMFTLHRGVCTRICDDLVVWKPVWTCLCAIWVVKGDVRIWPFESVCVLLRFYSVACDLQNERWVGVVILHCFIILSFKDTGILQQLRRAPKQISADSITNVAHKAARLLNISFDPAA